MKFSQQALDAVFYRPTKKKQKNYRGSINIYLLTMSGDLVCKVKKKENKSQ